MGMGMSKCNGIVRRNHLKDVGTSSEHALLRHVVHHRLKFSTFSINFAIIHAVYPEAKERGWVSEFTLGYIWHTGPTIRLQPIIVQLNSRESIAPAI